LAALLIGACGGAVAAQQARQGTPVVDIALPLKFPAVGNIEGVVQWRFGRLEDVTRLGQGEISLRIRMADRTVTVTGPGPQLAELAWRSNWVRNQSQTIPGSSDLSERMIAFDYDPSMRVIAMASLEPLDRNRTRLRRALGA
jgi:hypothetical protein